MLRSSGMMESVLIDRLMALFDNYDIDNNDIVIDSNSNSNSNNNSTDISEPNDDTDNNNNTDDNNKRYNIFSGSTRSKVISIQYTDAARELKLSLIVAKEHVLMCEERGLLCRDESHRGVSFYRNLFKQF